MSPMTTTPTTTPTPPMSATTMMKTSTTTPMRPTKPQSFRSQQCHKRNICLEKPKLWTKKARKSGTDILFAQMHRSRFVSIFWSLSNFDIFVILVKRLQSEFLLIKDLLILNDRMLKISHLFWSVHFKAVLLLFRKPSRHILQIFLRCNDYH